MRLLLFLSTKDEEDDICCCGTCGLTKEHIETFIFWAVLCCARRSNGRSQIKYTNYKPLSSEDSQHGQSTMIRGGHGSNEEDSSSQLSDDLEKKYDSSTSLIQKVSFNWF